MTQATFRVFLLAMATLLALALASPTSSRSGRTTQCGPQSTQSGSSSTDIAISTASVLLPPDPNVSFEVDAINGCFKWCASDQLSQSEVLNHYVAFPRTFGARHTIFLISFQTCRSIPHPKLAFSERLMPETCSTCIRLCTFRSRIVTRKCWWPRKKLVLSAVSRPVSNFIGITFSLTPKRLTIHHSIIFVLGFLPRSYPFGIV